MRGRYRNSTSTFVAPSVPLGEAVLGIRMHRCAALLSVVARAVAGGKLSVMRCDPVSVRWGRDCGCPTVGWSSCRAWGECWRAVGE